MRNLASVLFLIFVSACTSEIHKNEIGEANSRNELASPLASTNGQLSDNIRITSKALGYDLQYRVYLPKEMGVGDDLPTLYITDGEPYARRGRMVDALNKGISKGEIKPVIAIFVDARDPGNLKTNRRNDQFFCNKNYVGFFTSELQTLTDQTYPTSNQREGRVILGVSFGGYNSACFGLMAGHVFGGIAMNSPANSQLLKVMTQRYDKVSKKT